MAQVKENMRVWVNKAAAPYLCDQDEGDLYDAYLELKDVADDGGDWKTADDYVVIWEPLQNKTVKEIIELIEAGIEETPIVKTYTADQLFKIIELNDWSACICNHEPEPELETIQVALEDDVEYFGEFVGNPAEDEFKFEFYTI